MLELVAVLFADRRGDDLLNAFPVVRMDDVPVPCDRRRRIGLIDTYYLEVLPGDRLGVSRDQ
jgi:hypothetical protein